jgi:hypothetical protein
MASILESNMATTRCKWCPIKVINAVIFTIFKVVIAPLTYLIATLANSRSGEVS